ncbi:response regulator transcription factor [Ihubacter massiliensis]|uniref:Stage 0 sporulation protein A homolog n=1 Tax=Hominibacterium faecale TaxID=2839743 RepID=A0A9J6QRL9_9FIRM|nr:MULTISPECIES: response regulator transcription factor [Eubacteriales Family XIII. Incertae Sedis]MCO7123796.1 response regulator transcription factor [Ihubacter massiliensis]MCU7378722.1 response regulator transcription factor [Hominibacterium faecale]
MNRILIIEDDPTLNEGIAMTLEGPDVHLQRAETLKQAREIIKAQLPDLILLDVNLPDGNGFEFCKELRRQTDLPIIFLTANDMELDIVRGLELGGDDYITKPFSLMILRARVNSVLRRRGDKQTAEQSALFRSGGLNLDFYNMNFSRDGQPVILSRTEQKLLKLLVVNQGQVLSKELLLDRVWGTEYVDDHALTVTIKRLRDKLGTRQIKSIYGIGYRWEKEDE